MAIRQDIKADDHWFTGEKKILEFTIFKEDGETLEENIDQWTMSWALRQSDRDPEPFLMKLTAAGVEVVDVPTAKVQVTIAATDTEAIRPGKYIHALKRTDLQNEQILTYGNVILQRTAAQ